MEGNAVYYGIDTPIKEPLKLRAGPLTVLYGNGMLRSIKFGDTEIVRRIYMALRDSQWNTIAGEIREFDIQKNENSFLIEFTCSHKFEDIDFRWNGIITGTDDGSISFGMKSEAVSSFRYNRIGFCVLHPLDLCVGRQCKIETSEGVLKEALFPVFIEPAQPFTDIRAITYRVTPQLESTIRFEGDVFEMEDQRNWTDASFKTYCPPLKGSLPLFIEKGEKHSRSIHISIDKLIPPPVISHKPLEIQVSSTSFSRPVPDIGVMLSKGDSVSPIAAEKLQALSLTHIRFDIDVDGEKVIDDMEFASDICTRLGLPAELAIHFSSIGISELDLISRLLRASQIPVRRFLIFKKNESSTSRDTVTFVKPILQSYAPGARICAGTDGHFVEVNRSHPPSDLLDCVCYGATPQVHTFDNEAVMENLPGLAETLRSSYLFLGEAQPVISPITMRPRKRPDAPRKFGGPDPRQMGLFCAAWTLGSLMYCIEGGASSLTCFDATGPGGLMPQNGISVYPVYHVLANIGEMAGATVQSCFCSDYYKIAGIVMNRDVTTILLIANLTDCPQQVTVFDLPETIHHISLDELSFDEATNFPLQWRCKKGESHSSSGPLHIFNLQPYGLMRVEAVWP